MRMSELHGHALRLDKKALAETLAPQVVSITRPRPRAGEAVVEVLAAAINVSDAKAALGMMPHAVWPRTPGRDFAGRVVDGPAEWLGAEVWGTGGDLGITRDGSHARWLELPLDALCRKPVSVSIAAAGAVGVPFVTAFEGLRRAGIQAGQSVAVFGAGGKVGQAVLQLVRRAGATAIAIGRDARASAAAQVMATTGGRGVDIAYNTVGSPYFQAALDSLAVGATQVLISTIDRSVPFDILPFYRRNLQMLGVDSLKLTAVHCARILEQLGPGFDDGSLQAFEVGGPLLALAQAPDAFKRVLAGTRERVVMAPD
jgi:NADPH:quinone reductase-like Zn-dependent oxidoreductase